MNRLYFLLLMMGLWFHPALAQNPSTLVVEKPDATSASINFKNSVGFWHLSGPRSWESSNNFSIFWHDGATYNGIMTLVSNGYVGIDVTNPIEKFQIGDSFLFHDGGHKVMGFMYRPSGGVDLHSDKYAAEIRFDPVNGYLRIGTSNTLTDTPVTRIAISKDGKIGMGTLDTGSHRLAVEGSIGAREVKVEVGTWSDYVFAEDYDLPTLEEVERHIRENGHLINIPTAKEVETNGVALGEMNRLLLEKIEELTLYVIALKKENGQIAELQRELKLQKKEIEKLQESLNNVK